MKELETQRLILRPITQNDINAIFHNWANDPDVEKYVTWNAHKSISDAQEVMNYWLDEYKKDNCYRYGIEHKEDHVLIGMIDVVDFHQGNFEIGSCLGKKYWNRGYMSETLQAVLQELFSAEYNTIIIEAVKENIGSNRVIQKAGFIFVESRKTELSKIKPEIITTNSYSLSR